MWSGGDVMSIFGIVSEFNPFHLGHEYLISCARGMGADGVACVMSGNATQRGELAIVDKYLRAEAALCGGADLVLELPFPWSSASAEGFASAAIHILSSFCDTVIFGSECGDVELLQKVADFTFSDAFREKYSELLLEGKQSAASYVSLIESEIGVTLSSNDLLGVEYIKAAKAEGVELCFKTVKRQGSAYLSDESNNEGFDSAMAIRKMLFDGNAEELQNRLPQRSFEVLKMAKKNGDLLSQSKYTDSVVAYFRLLNNTTDEAFAESDGGVLERICKTAHETTDNKGFWESLSTKRYTDSKLRRAVIFAMCNVRKNDIKSFPAYTMLLAANERGRQMLGEARRLENITVITKPADVSELGDVESQRQSELNLKLASIYNFCLERSASTGQSMRKKPYIT